MVKKLKIGLGAVAQAYNPSTLGGRGGWITRSRDRDHSGQHGETPSLLKIQKISWARWRMPVIPATQEAEAGELPEPSKPRLRWAEIAPLHSLGNKSETPSQKKKKKKKKMKLKINNKEIDLMTVKRNLILVRRGETTEMGRSAVNCWWFQWMRFCWKSWASGTVYSLI